MAFAPRSLIALAVVAIIFVGIVVAIVVRRFQTSERMEGVWPASSLPLRSILALAVVAVLAALIVWMVVLFASSRLRSVTARAVLIGAVLALTAIALWIVFILPAYWD